MARRRQRWSCRALRLRNKDGRMLPASRRICPDPSFEVGLHHSAQIGLDEDNWIANEGSNPVAPVGIFHRKLRIIVRSFLLIATEGSRIVEPAISRHVVHAPIKYLGSWHLTAEKSLRIRY
jgi:hypothetical protein